MKGRRMRIIDTTSGVDLSDLGSIESYWNDELIKALYFGPKGVSADTRDTALASPAFAQSLAKLRELSASCSLASQCSKLVAGFERDTGHSLAHGTLYLVLGCATTTIYTVTVDDSDVSVLCLESLGGSTQALALYLTHEFTHFVRKDLLNRDIFESCIGERLVTEGIAESYSADVVPDQTIATYCIVDEETVSWVEAHYNELEAYVRTGLDTSKLMEPLFYMFARIDFPVRTGYVFGYLVVRRYLQDQGLQTKDILGVDWRRVFCAHNEEKGQTCI